jgi:hypothetical protein
MKMGAETSAIDTAEAEKIVTLTAETTEAGDRIRSGATRNG